MRLYNTGFSCKYEFNMYVEIGIMQFFFVAHTCMWSAFLPNSGSVAKNNNLDVFILFLDMHTFYQHSLLLASLGMKGKGTLGYPIFSYASMSA